MGQYILEQMNGFIDVESEEGEGTCFRITVPFVISDHSDHVRQSVRPVENLQREFLPIQITRFKKPTSTVLLVEDNNLSAKSICLILVKLKIYEVV